MARRLYVTPGQHISLGQVVELNKRFLYAYQKFKDEPRVQQLKGKVLKYNRLVHDLGLRDHQVSVHAVFHLQPGCSTDLCLGSWSQERQLEDIWPALLSSFGAHSMDNVRIAGRDSQRAGLLDRLHHVRKESQR